MRILPFALGLQLLSACHLNVDWSYDPAAPDAPAAAPSSTSAMNNEVKPPSAVFPYAVHRATLDNGLRVLIVPMPAGGLVAYWSIVRTGSRDEVEPGVTGFAHFFEHVMFKGTDKRPGGEYDRIVNGMGADANAFTNEDFTAYHLSFAKEDLPTVVEIEADRFQNLKYSEDEFRTESGAVYGEYRKGRTSPFEVLDEAVRDAAFERHTYKHTTIGFEADVKAMPGQYEYSKGFFKRFYRPENVVLVVAGDVEPAATLALVKKEYAGWKRGYEAPAVPEEPPQTAQKRIDVPFDGQTLPILAMCFKSERFMPRDTRMVAGTLIGELAFGETSPLYKKLVLDEQRLDSLGADFSANRDPGLWAVYGLVKDPADVAAIEGEVWSAIDELRRAAPAQERLDAARSRRKYSFLTDLSTPSGVCGRLARMIAHSGDVDALDQFYATLDGLSPEDVRAAADHFLRPERSTVAVVHAKDEAIPSPKSAEPPVLLPVEQDPNVAFKVWFKVGSQDDPPGKEGLAALTGALLSEGGTQSLAYDQILAKLYPLAAGYGASVDKEMTIVSGESHRDKVGAFYGLYTAALLEPGFRAEDFERLKDSALNSIEKELRYTSDEELGKAALHGEVYAGTPYGHLQTGTVSALKSIMLEDVKSFWREHYTKDNCVIALGGAYPKDLPDRLLADLARLPEGKPAPVAASKAQPIVGRKLLIVQKPGPATAFSLGYPIDVRRGSREFYALWIANSWLGEHRNSASHLYQVIREARGINYGNYSYIEAFPNGGQRSMPPTGAGRRAQLFEVWLRPVPHERALFTLRAGLRELEMLAKNGLTREQFEFQRKLLEKYCLHFAETTDERLGYAVDDRFYGLTGSHLATFRKLMREITLEEVNAAVKKHLRADDLQIAIVTEDGKGMADRIAADELSPIDYGDDKKPPEILAEDKQIESYPLGIIRERITIVPVEQMFER